MGSLSKRLGQLTALSLESESSQILRTIKPNKVPNSLSQRLDTTLKDSHDMKVFGLGTLASMASRERYLRFTSSLYGIYSTMENELDKCCCNSSGDPAESSKSKTPAAAAVAHFWNKHSTILRRSPLLKRDMEDVSRLMMHNRYNSLNMVDYELPGGFDKETNSIVCYSPATIDYMNAIRKAGKADREHGTARLLGHAYTRYLADLMGGSVLGVPTRMALGLREGMPTQYSFDFPPASVLAEDSKNNNINVSAVVMSRKEYVESIYHDLNEAGQILEKNNTKKYTDEEDVLLLEEVVEEAREAFRHNVKVYAEEPIVFDSVVGLKNIATGWVMQR